MTTSVNVAVSCRGLSRRFGMTQALAGIDLDITAGTVHALVGENGAGKSTALGVIAGRIEPSSGTVIVRGEELSYGDPRASRRAGVAAVYQELTIVPALSTQANVFLGQEAGRRGALREGWMREHFRSLCASLGLRLPVDVPAGTLSVADQQLLEILRGLVAEPEIVLFDEPTASLAPHERDVLFGVLRDLRVKGTTIVLVSHNLDEVLAIADDISVFRNGHLAATGPATGWSKDSLVEAMLGRSLTAADALPRPRMANGEALLRVEGLSVPGALYPLDLEVQAGEILGIGGLVGSGRTTLLRALAGAAPGAGGRMFLDGELVAWPKSPRHALKRGIAMIPEDRQGSGLFTRMTAHGNIVVSDFGTVSTVGVVSGRREHRAAKKAVQDLAFDAGRLRSRVSALSGGNQQKLLVGRWRHARPRVLLADEPTRGVDIGAKEDIVRALRELAAEGVAVLIASSELEEVIGIADRVVVLSEGLLVGELHRAAGGFTTDAILRLAFRAQEAAA